MSVSKETQLNWERYFSRGSHKNIPFSRMSLEQKRKYCRSILDLLCEDYPKDKDLFQYASIGKKVLLGSRQDRMKSIFISEKENIKSLAVMLSIILSFHPNQLPKLPLHQNNISIYEGDEYSDKESGRE